MEATLRAYPDDLLLPALDFVRNLQLLRDPRLASPAVVEEWFISLDDLTSLSREDLTAERERILRSIERLGRLAEGDSGIFTNEGASIGEQLYRVRNSVIGHASIVTGMILFDRIVPAFDRFVSDLALLGRARLAGMSVAEARVELSRS